MSVSPGEEVSSFGFCQCSEHKYWYKQKCRPWLNFAT